MEAPWPQVLREEKDGKMKGTQTRTRHDSKFGFYEYRFYSARGSPCSLESMMIYDVKEVGKGVEEDLI